MTTTGAERDSPGWLRLIARAALRHRRNLVLAFAAALFGSAAQVVVPLVAREIVDEVIVARRDPLWPWLLVLFAVAGASFALAYVRRYRGGQVAYSVQLDLRNAVHDHLQRLDQGTLATLPTGQLVSRANSDSTLVVGLLSFLPLITGNAIQMVLAVVVMFVLSPPLAAVSLVVIPALFAVSYRMRTRIFPASWDAQQKEGDVAQIVDEGVNGVRVVKAFGQEARELERLTGVARTLYGARVRAVRLTARFQPLLEAIPTLAQVAMLLLGGLLALEGTISLGTFLAFSTYVGQFVAPSRQLAGLLTVGQQARAGVERIFGLLALRPGVVGGEVDLDRAEGALEFRDVRFGYGDIPVLDGFSLRIEPGERVALVGASGSGKSTAAMLVARFRDPQGGAVLLDGRDVRSLTLDSLRRQIGVAFEESFLFSDTIGANIAFGRPDATPAEIEAAARVAQAHDFVSRLPRGYDTVVGERGLTLSGGQRQRVALARAVLADPRILVLDDATSAIDATTEAAIHDGLRDVLDGRTTLLIAHRASTLHLADRIVVMAEGRAVEQGTHDELTASSARYRALLSGLAEEPLREAGDSIEALAAVTSDAWQPVVSPTGSARSTTAAARTSLAAAGGNTTSAIGGLPATPDLLAKVDALPPVRDDIEVDPARDHAGDRHFSLGGLLRQFRRAFVLGFGLVVLDAVFGLAGPALVRAGVDRGVVDESRGALFACAIAFLVVTAIDLAVRIGATFVTGRTAERIMFSLRVRIWSQLQRLSLDYYEREQAGRVMTRMTTDVDQFEQLVSNGLLGALVALVTFVGVGVALLLIDVELGLVVLSVMLPLGLATWWFRERSTRLYDLARDRIAVVNSAFQEDVSGIRETQAFGHEAASSRRFHDLGESYWRSRVAAQRLVSLYFPFVLFLSACADALVLGVGSALIDSGAITVGTLIAFLLYIDMFFAPIQQLSQVFDAWQQTRVSVNRIAEVMALDTLTPEPEQPEAWDERRGAMTVQRVGFVYPGAATDGEETLHDVDLHVSAGETVALVGQTGAGKSTVLKLLARFYDPVSGRVCVDEHDLRTLALGDFRRGLGYVPQESFLFTGPVRDNIAYGRPEASDAEVEAAARAVGAHEVIAALPDGYRTVLGERGGSLSSGQRQLIALARAQLADPVLLLLDEATSSLDLATEARVNRAMARVAHGRTTVVIAHRLPTARAADRIVVMADGTVVESGSHDELLAADGRYARMWRAFESVGAGA